MPGQVIRGHARFESECKACHVRFDRVAQPERCLDCHDHKAVAEDVRGKKGFHGRITERECRKCHTEHKGRDARIIALDEKTFDHKLTDFVLRGKHTSVTCAKCHRAGARHRSAPGDCLGCHRADDKHKGGLGPKCVNCHDESTWKGARFDHGKTHFPLRHGHAKAKCADCHAHERYAETPQDCLSCHRKDDAHKGHFGGRCEKCHNDANWKTPTFAHDRDTHFVLRGRHVQVKCQNCHRTPLFRDKTPTTCHACHRGDDPHKGSLGDKCETCHNERSWKTSSFDHDRDTRFALRSKHREAKCESCHKDTGFRDKLPLACSGCHEKDDKHKGELGNKCESCHNERAWRDASFDHERSIFPLRGRHAKVECKKCHLGSVFKEAKTDCASCHANDDYHKQRLGSRCEECHNPDSWKDWAFDHDQRSTFKLVGTHRKVRCVSCHTAPVRDKFELAKDCLSCHRKDDVHLETYGTWCEDCHVPEKWRQATKPPPTSKQQIRR